MAKACALILISHSAQLATGTAEVAAQMAPDVTIRPVGGTDDGRIGTSFDLVEKAVNELFDAGVEAVVMLTDLGSAALTAESVAELLDDDRLLQADAPFVEGTVAAAVAAQGGGRGSEVRDAAESAVGGRATRPNGVNRASGDPAGAATAPTEGALQERVTLRNEHGLHARPAATLARRVSEFDAQVSLNGVDAASVLAVMSLGLMRGAELHIEASGPQARAALDAVVAEVEAGLGDELGG